MRDRAVLCVSAAFVLATALSPMAVQAENAKYGLSSLASTGAMKLVRPGLSDGKSSIFRKPGSLASLRQRSAARPGRAAPGGGDFGWFWTEAMPTAASDRDGVAPGLVRFIDDRRSRGLPVWGHVRTGEDIYMRFREAIDRASAETGVSQAVIAAVIAIESAGVATATSPKGAMGLMQLMPATAERFGVSQAYDPFDNISGGARYLAELIKLHKGDFVLVLASYNAGEGAVDKHNGVPPYDETRDYVAKFFSVYAAAKSFCKNSPDDPAVNCEHQV